MSGPGADLVLRRRHGPVLELCLFPAAGGPGYLGDTLGRTHRFGELKGGAR